MKTTLYCLCFKD